MGSDPGGTGGQNGFTMGGTCVAISGSQAVQPLPFFWRTDGYFDGYNVIQGARSYDGNARQWTSMDRYGGSPMDPMSEQPYVWNGNDPTSNTDPSGNYVVHGTPDPGPDCAFAVTDGACSNDLPLLQPDVIPGGLTTIAVVKARCEGNPGGAYTLPKTDLTGQPLSWSSIYATGAANQLDPVAYYANEGNGGRFDIQVKDLKSLPLRYTGMVGVGVYGVAAGFSQSLIDAAIVTIAYKNRSPKEIPTDQYFAHVGINFALKHCK